MLQSDIEMGDQQDISWIFDQYAGSDGRIAVSSFAEIVEKYRRNLPEKTIAKLLLYADKNKDGYITREELDILQSEDAKTISRKTGVSVSELTTFNKGVRAVGNFVLTNDEDKKQYYEHYSCVPPPLFMILVSVAEIAVYIYYGITLGEWLTYDYDLLKSPLVFDPRYRQQAWRFVSYMLVHAGLEHVGFNVFVQLILGVPLEMVHGPVRLGAIYLAGVVAGSLASSIFDPCTILVGASGGVYAMFTAHLANVILNGDVMHKVSSLLRTIFVLFILCFDFGYSIYRRFDSSTGGAKVSFVAHVAGAIAGLSVGLMVLKNFKKSLTDKVLFWVAVALYVCLMVFAILWNIFWHGYDDCFA